MPRMGGSMFDMPRSTSAYAAARDFDYHNHTASFARPTFARPPPTAAFARPLPTAAYPRPSSFGRPPMTDSYAGYDDSGRPYTSGMPDFRRPYTSGRVSLNGFDDY